jgi:hypothetical protein
MPNREFMKVQVKLKIGGSWRDFEDWTAEPYKQLCRDRKDERVEELILIVSNSEVNRGVEQPFRYPKQVPMLASTSNVGCFRGWERTSTTVTGGSPIVADSTTTAVDVVSRAGRRCCRAASPSAPWYARPRDLGGDDGAARRRSWAPARPSIRPAPRAPPAHRRRHARHQPRPRPRLQRDRRRVARPQADHPDRQHDAHHHVDRRLSRRSTRSRPGTQSWEWLHVDDPTAYAVSADGRTIEGRFTSPLPGGYTIDSAGSSPRCASSGQQLRLAAGVPDDAGARSSAPSTSQRIARG